MRKLYPLGRGGRGSRQRVFVQVKRCDAGALKTNELTFGIQRIAGYDIRTLHLGVSNLSGKRRVFFTSQISQTVQEVHKAVKNFSAVRKANKIKIDRPTKKG